MYLIHCLSLLTSKTKRSESISESAIVHRLKSSQFWQVPITLQLSFLLCYLRAMLFISPLKKITNKQTKTLVFGNICFWRYSFFFFSFLYVFCILGFLLVCLFFEIKNIYSNTHSTMRAGD